MNKYVLTAAISVLALGLTACGGDSKSDDKKETTAQTKFSDLAVEFVADFSEKDSVCYDVDSQSEVDCQSNEDSWDVRFEKNGFNIWLNGGIFGEGDGGAFGPRELSVMQEYNGGADVPGYFKDQVSGVFLDNSWYAYSLNGQHKLWPNYRVYVVESNAKHYKLRLNSFYAPQDSSDAAPGTSGVISFEYEEITNGVTGATLAKTIDASAGGFSAKADDPLNKYSYFNFASGDVIELTDDEAATSTDWDIAFKRTAVKINSFNGSAETKASVAQAQADFYDGEGEAIKETFLAATKDSEQAEYDAVTTASLAALTFTADENKSVLDGKWYSYAGAPTHAFDADPASHWIVRNAEADDYFIFNVKTLARAGGEFTSITADFYLEVTE